jgi:hypothetical protein
MITSTGDLNSSDANCETSSTRVPYVRQNGEVLALDEPGLANLFEHGNGLGCLARTTPEQASDAIISPRLLRVSR